MLLNGDKNKYIQRTLQQTESLETASDTDTFDSQLITDGADSCQFYFLNNGNTKWPNNGILYRYPET